MASPPTTSPSGTGACRDGELFSDDDVRTKKKVVVLGATVAKNLFPDGGAVGAAVQLGRSPFTVVGVLDAKGQTRIGQ